MIERKVILYIAMSLDGYIATENNELDWLSIVEIQMKIMVMKSLFKALIP